MFGDYLDFDGNTNLARVRGNVRLIDHNTVLETDSLDFDRNINLGYFFKYGTLSDEESTLSSYYGEYSIDSKEAFFQYDVSLENPKFRLLSDTLRYNTASKKAFLLDRSVLYNKKKEITADSLYYDIAAGYSEAFGDIVFSDTLNRNMLKGEYAYVNEIVDSAYITDRAMVIDFSQKDSLFMHADTIWAVSYNIDTDSLYRRRNCGTNHN